MMCVVVTTIFLLFQITNAMTTSAAPAQNTVCGNFNCSNYAKCRNDSSGELECMCRIGYKGVICDDDIDECSSRHDPCMHRGRCYNSIGSYRCDCLEGWLDDHCETMDNSTIDHLCMPGWIGVWCQDQCLNDSMCRPTEYCNGYKCHCASGWDGIICDIDQDECVSAPCPKTATCMNTPGSYECPCSSGWKGDKCDEDINECLINPCQHASNCTNAQGYYNCTCALGWKGSNCSEDIDECASNPCTNGKNRICVNSIGSFVCTCAPGWDGVNCTEDVNECMMPVNITESPCKHSALCTNTLGSFICNCTSGWHGGYCDVDIDECTENPCNVSFACENNPGSFSCSAKQMSSSGTSDSRNTYIIVGAVLSSLLVIISIAACIAIIKYKGKAKRVVTEECKGQQQQQ